MCLLFRKKQGKAYYIVKCDDKYKVEIANTAEIFRKTIQKKIEIDIDYIRAMWYYLFRKKSKQVGKIWDLPKLLKPCPIP